MAERKPSVGQIKRLQLDVDDLVVRTLRELKSQLIHHALDFEPIRSSSARAPSKESPFIRKLTASDRCSASSRL
jgi:hypothetical protein